MKIVIDGRMLSWTGVGRYTHALLEELEKLDADNEYVVLIRRADWDKWAPTAPNFTRFECNIDPYTAAEQFALPKLLSRLEPDLVHFVTPNAGAMYAGRKLVTVHDLTLLDFDTSRGSAALRLVKRLKRVVFRWVFLRQLATATSVVTPTEYVRGQLIERFGVPPDHVFVTWEAGDADHLTAAEAQNVPGLAENDAYLLYVGNYFPYKNAGLLIEAFALVSREHPELKLVLAGKADEFKEELVMLTDSLGIKESVVMPGFVSDGQLKWLYEHGRLYVYPSLSEGFGLQGLEAMSQGLPVLAAEASSLPEVYGEAAVYFDPKDAGDLAGKIKDLLADDKARLALAAKGHERVKAFSWKRMAELTHQAYLDAMRS